MSIKKRIAAIGAAAVMVMSMSAIGASASYAKSYTLRNTDRLGKCNGKQSISCATLGGKIGELHWYWTGSKGYSQCTSDGYKHFAVVKGKSVSTSADVKATKTATTDKVKPKSNKSIYFGGTVLT